MRIAIIVAMSKELALLEPLIKNRIDGEGCRYGKIGGHDVVVAQCGIGKVNAALKALAIIDGFKPDMVINTGVAGGVGRTRPLDIIMPEAVGYHDVWCGPGTEWGQADNCPRLFECNLPAEIERKGILASGDIFISRPEEVKHILEVYPEAVACDMESAAIAQTCYKKGVDFACIRVISDTPGSEDNIAQYENFWDDAPRASFKALISLLEKL